MLITTELVLSYITVKTPDKRHGSFEIETSCVEKIPLIEVNCIARIYFAEIKIDSLNNSLRFKSLPRIES